MKIACDLYINSQNLKMLILTLLVHAGVRARTIWSVKILHVTSKTHLCMHEQSGAM